MLKCDCLQWQFFTYIIIILNLVKLVSSTLYVWKLNPLYFYWKKDFVYLLVCLLWIKQKKLAFKLYYVCRNGTKTEKCNDNACLYLPLWYSQRWCSWYSSFSSVFCRSWQVSPVDIVWTTVTLTIEEPEPNPAPSSTQSRAPSRAVVAGCGGSDA